MKHLSLFSGIGGLDLAAEWAGFETVAFVERDPYCQRVLAKRWPGIPVVDDVRRIVADANDRQREPAHGALQAGGAAPRYGGELITIVSGGFPCQPHSIAGKRGASADDRDLWPEFARVIREICPRWIVAENVPGLLNSESGRFFGAVLGDLAGMGYSAGWGVWGARDVGALHKRDRVFIVAHSEHSGPSRPGRESQPQSTQHRAFDPGAETLVVANDERCEHPGEGHPRRRQFGEGQPNYSAAPGTGWWDAEPDVGRVAHGVPSRVDRLRALGNAVVPQQAYPLFAEIARLERMTSNARISSEK